MTKPADIAFLRYGFRPLYLVASAFAAIQVPLWVLAYLGHLPQPEVLAGSLGHGHEMTFGFTTAVIAGFLLTAARNWTGRETIWGTPLALLVLVWLAGRLLIAVDLGQSWWVVLGVDLLFLPLTAIAIARPILATGNRRNMAFPMILLLLTGANAVLHLADRGVIDIDPYAALQVALDLIMIVVVVLGGRVIPFFSRNALPQAGIQTFLPLDLAAILATLSVLLLDLTGWISHPVAVWVLFLAAGLHLARSLSWKPWATLGNPMLWVLHLGYAWIAIHYLLRAMDFGGLGNVTPELAVHALTVGAIGTLTLGMMSRTARGHSGLPILASRIETTAFILVTLAALSRVLPGLVAPDLTLITLWLSAGLWTLSHLLYLVKFVPILTCLSQGGS